MLVTGGKGPAVGPEPVTAAAAKQATKAAVASKLPKRVRPLPSAAPQLPPPQERQGCGASPDGDGRGHRCVMGSGGGGEPGLAGGPRATEHCLKLIRSAA